MPVIPDWLKAPDVGALYSHGLATGAGVAEANARLAAEQRRVDMETQIRMQQIQKQAELRQAELQTQRAYHEAQTGLRQQRLEQFAQQNELRNRQAAMRVADQQGFAEDLRAGMDTRAALTRHPMLATPTALTAAASAADRAKMFDESQTMRKRALDLQERGIDLREKQAKSPQLTGTYTLPPTRFGQPSPGRVSGPLPMLQDRFGTNLPPAMRIGGPATNAPVAAPPAPTDQSGPVQVSGPDDVKKLAPGTLFINPADGKTYRKKG